MQSHRKYAELYIHMKYTNKFLMSFITAIFIFVGVTFAQTQKETSKSVFDKEDQLQNGSAVRFYEISNAGLVTLG